MRFWSGKPGQEQRDQGLDDALQRLDAQTNAVVAVAWLGCEEELAELRYEHTTHVSEFVFERTLLAGCYHVEHGSAGLRAR
jgi:hypothetical protein